MGIEGDKNLGHGSELFMAADSKMITIGGGLVSVQNILTLTSDKFIAAYTQFIRFIHYITLHIF